MQTHKFIAIQYLFGKLWYDMLYEWIIKRCCNAELYLVLEQTLQIMDPLIAKDLVVQLIEFHDSFW